MQTTTIRGFPLSPQQRRLWLLQQGAGAYRSHCVIKIEGDLDESALREAADLTAERHEILRTLFRRLPGFFWPVQVVAEECPPLWQSLDLSDYDEPDRKEVVGGLVEQELRGVSDLEQGPVVRFMLLKLAPREHLLIVALPALCADARTLNNLAEELGRGYEACLAGSLPSGDPLPYVQFSEWQNEILGDEEAEEGKEFWRRQDLSALSALALPYGDGAGRAAHAEVKSLRVGVGAELSARLDALAARRGMPVEVLLHACWQTLLWRLTGRAEIITGQVFDGREHEVLEDALGLFEKWLPVRCEFTAGLRLGDVASQVEASAGASRRWQEYFTWQQDGPAVEAPTGDAAPAPFFPFAFQFERRPAATRFAGLSFSLVELRHGGERFDLKLHCTDDEGALAAEFEYDAALFEAADIARLAEEFRTLLAAAVGSPEVPLSELEIMGEAERSQVLVGWNDTGAAFPREKSLGELFDEQAECTPHRAAVVSDVRSLTYAELNARANQLAHFLRARGVGPETRVGLCMRRSVEMVVALLGVLKAGGAYVPLDPSYPHERLRFILEDSGAEVLLTQRELAETLPRHGADVVCLDRDRLAVSAQSTESPASGVGPDNLAYVIYTSGSTGRPKGVMVRHSSVINLAAALYRAIYAHHDAPLNVSLNAPLAFDASVKQVVQLLSGHTLHVIPEELRLDAAGLLDFMERRQLHVLDCTPSQLRLLLTAGLTERPNLTAKAVLVGGEALDRQAWKTLAEQTSICFYNVYGPTECTVDATSCDVRASSARPVIGRPLANVRAYVLDGGMQPVPVGVAGELYVGGDGVARGYLGRPELTAERFLPDPFSGEAGARLYRTGDLARLLPDGQIEFIGRVDNQVKIHGFRIELGEIEAALNAYAGVRECAVLVREDVPGDGRLAAYFVPAQMPAPPAGELRQFLRRTLPEYMVPSAFVALKALPLTRHGKVDRRALPAPEAARQEVGETYVAPANEIEETIARIWSEVLGVERVGVHDNFFDLGGHSLLMVQAHSRLREAFPVEASIVELFKHPTVSALAQFFSAGQSQQPSFQKLLSRAEKRKTAVNRRAQSLKERNRT